MLESCGAQFEQFSWLQAVGWLVPAEVELSVCHTGKFIFGKKLISEIYLISIYFECVANLLSV